SPHLPDLESDLRLPSSGRDEVDAHAHHLYNEWLVHGRECRASLVGWCHPFQMHLDCLRQTTRIRELVHVELKDYVRLLRNHWVGVVLIVVVCVALGAAWTVTRTPIYAANA